MASAGSTTPNLNQRAQLRQATYIDPLTGSRRKKRFTLYSFDGQNGPTEQEEAETCPLLQHQQQQSGTTRQHGVSRTWQKFRRFGLEAWEFISSDTGRAVFKCSLAYLLGSMATFLPVFSSLFGTQDSKHLVASITVYFHPARSLGSMFDALILAFCGFVYTAFISVTSMSVSVLFGDILQLMALGHAIVLLVFIGGGLGLIGWFKLKMNDPLVNIACAVTSLALTIILTREGAVQAADFSFATISQILEMTVAGIVATLLVSIFIFPISARERLKENMVDVTDALADMLAMITSSFISGTEAELQDQSFSRASTRHRKSLSKLRQTLKEAKYEHYFFGTERLYTIEARSVYCVQRITQSIGGLRSAATMQFALIKQPSTLHWPSSTPKRASYGSIVSASPFLTAAPHRSASGEAGGSFLASIAETPEEERLEEETIHPLPPRRSSIYRSPPQIFEMFISELGPSMKSLAFTLKEILDELPYDSSSNYAVSTHPKFRTSLERALDLYKDARKAALEAIYDKNSMDRDRPIDVEADWEEAAASCGHFSFSLIEVAEQMRDYLDILDEMQLEVEEMPSGRSWSWMKFWQSPPVQSRFANLDPEFQALVDRADELDVHVKVPEVYEQKSTSYLVPDARQSIRKQKFFRRVYDNLSFFRHDDVKFAIKVGIGSVIYALPAFIPSTRPFYTHWRGEWGLLSYMLVCSMTIGAVNTTGYSRFIGSCFGAFLAISAWEIADGNPYLLTCLGFIMAYWTAYIIVGKGKGPMGRFIMLTYNLSALNAYSLSVADDDGNGDEYDKARRPLILNLVLHRLVAVLSGCIWGLIVTRMVWPISARRKLKAGLSLLWLRMGLIWKRDPLAIFLESQQSSTPSSPKYMDLREEMELGRFLTKLKTLVDAAKSEFELRGPFPATIYSNILDSTGRMLDAFHAMNVVILKDLHASPGEQRLLQATRHERAELCARISHLFGVLASCMKLEYPIFGEALLPGTDTVRDRLLARVFTFRKEMADQSVGPRGEANQGQRPDGHSGDDESGVSDEDFSLLYTYALVTGQLSLEIRNVLKQIEELFGVLDEDVLRIRGQL